jgi:hypothetical protein
LPNIPSHIWIVHLFIGYIQKEKDRPIFINNNNAKKYSYIGAYFLLYANTPNGMDNNNELQMIGEIGFGMD